MNAAGQGASEFFTTEYAETRSAGQGRQFEKSSFGFDTGNPPTLHGISGGVPMDLRSVDFKSPSASGGAGFRVFSGELPPPSLRAWPSLVASCLRRKTRRRRSHEDTERMRGWSTPTIILKNLNRKGLSILKGD